MKGRTVRCNRTHDRYRAVGRGLAPAPSRDTAHALFDALESSHDHLIRAEIAQVEAIERLCSHHSATDPDAYGPLFERLVSSGADGTPDVSEWLCLEIGPILAISASSAACRIAQVMDLMHRHPVLHSAARPARCACGRPPRSPTPRQPRVCLPRPHAGSTPASRPTLLT